MQMISRYLSRFPLNFISWNFSDIIGSRQTIKYDKTIVSIVFPVMVPKIFWAMLESAYSNARAKETTASALAGDARPLNDSFCVSSVLNRASRIAAQTGIMAGTARRQKSGKDSVLTLICPEMPIAPER